MSIPAQYNPTSLAASTARIAGARRSSSRLRASPKVRWINGENTGSPAIRDSAAAPPDRIVSLVTAEVHQQLVTFVNVNIIGCEVHATSWDRGGV